LTIDDFSEKTAIPRGGPRFFLFDFLLLTFYFLDEYNKAIEVGSSFMSVLVEGHHLLGAEHLFIA
jgi:hypothetical protein